MVDVNKLKGKLIENGVTVGMISSVLRINPSTFYRKLKNNSFEIGEADIIAQTLKLSLLELNEIFFGQYVA